MEIEGKFKVKDLKALRNKLAKLGIKEKTIDHEENKLYDIFNILGRSRYIFRLRKTKQYFLTIKGPTKNSLVNSRKEYEFKIPKILYYILDFILPVKASYNKVRETYNPKKGISICLDKVLGLGYFVEIEANDEKEVLLWKKKLGIKSKLIREPYFILVSNN